jgi:hypothetical protein
MAVLKPTVEPVEPVAQLPAAAGQLATPEARATPSKGSGGKAQGGQIVKLINNIEKDKFLTLS